MSRIVEVTCAEWTADGLLRHVVYLGERGTSRLPRSSESGRNNAALSVQALYRASDPYTRQPPKYVVKLG
jgi:hypothetical protein